MNSPNICSNDCTCFLNWSNRNIFSSIDSFYSCSSLSSFFGLYFWLVFSLILAQKPKYFFIRWLELQLISLLRVLIYFCIRGSCTHFHSILFYWNNHSTFLDTLSFCNYKTCFFSFFLKWEVLLIGMLSCLFCVSYLNYLRNLWFVPIWESSRRH